MSERERDREGERGYRVRLRIMQRETNIIRVGGKGDGETFKLLTR